MNTAAEREFLKDLDRVLKKYSLHNYNPRVVVEILSRSLKGKDGAHSELTSTSPGQIFHLQRVQRGLSLSELSKMTGIPKGNLSAMENGKRPIGVKMAKVLARALGINYAVLL